MTEPQIKNLGFTLDKEYKHDQFVTRRYVKEVLEVEFTYEGTELVTCDLSIQEVNCHPVSFSELKLLDQVFVKPKKASQLSIKDWKVRAGRADFA